PWPTGRVVCRTSCATIRHVYEVEITSGQLRRPVLRNEVLLILGVSAGVWVTNSLLSLLDKLTRAKPLASQTTQMNVSVTPDRPWLDLLIQLTSILFTVVPALFAIHLLNRDGDAKRVLGIDRTRPVFDGGAGILLAAAIGIPGIGLYVLARAIGINTTV